jgi:hypothetical protein
MHFFCVVLSRLEAPTVVAEAKKQTTKKLLFLEAPELYGRN